MSARHRTLVSRLLGGEQDTFPPWTLEQGAGDKNVSQKKSSTVFYIKLTLKKI